MSVPRFSRDQCHHIAHIAYPEIYRAAMAGGVIWMSLWDGQWEVEGVKRKPALLRFEDLPGKLEIVAKDRKLKAPRKLHAARIGYSMTETDTPFHWVTTWETPIKGDHVTGTFKLTVTGD